MATRQTDERDEFPTKQRGHIAFSEASLLVWTGLAMALSRRQTENLIDYDSDIP
jgi:hypothetical protein